MSLGCTTWVCQYGATGVKDIVLPMDHWYIGCLEEYGWSHSFRVVPGALPWRSPPSTICFLMGVVVWPGLDRRTYCCTYFAPNQHQWVVQWCRGCYFLRHIPVLGPVGVAD